jgi:hypothetical protein
MDREARSKTRNSARYGSKHHQYPGKHPSSWYVDVHPSKIHGISTYFIAPEP